PETLAALVFIDKNIDPIELGPQVINSLFVKNVCCDNEAGGQDAAQIILDSFHSQGVSPDHQRFMVLRGLEGGDARAEGFESTITSLYPDKEIRHPDSKLLNFTRSKARRWMDQELDAWLKGRNNEFGHEVEDVAWGIFACNDEMALGVRFAVADRYRFLRSKLTAKIQAPAVDADVVSSLLAKVLFLQRIRIVGFDGIAAALDLIEKADGNYPEWLIGTIRAQVEQQSKEAINWLRLLQDSPALLRTQDTVKKVPVAPVVRM
ncbi:MAG TPA: hypothetical protein VK403_13045, partial [Allosphingosinicella sp.]|nr:hypothetical protein [Allosphingosinicella sp.]